jgi:4-hydroxy-2-oxovalerate/4-hydroxy-2-oxohexanoate aldolase
VDLHGKKVTLHDMSLRDGMHAKRHQISIDEMVAVACGLDQAGMPLIEVTHGDGLGGASVNYGFPAHSDEEYLAAVVPKMKQARISVLHVPGIGTLDHIRMAADMGASTIRIATHCTEADISEQHIGMGRDLGMDTVGFLMMAHMIDEKAFLQQALLMESYGANCIYCTDSAGYMLPDEVTAKISTLRRRSRTRQKLAFTATTIWQWASPIRWPLSRRAQIGSTARWPASVRVQAIRLWRCFVRSSIVWVLRMASISTRLWMSQKIWWCP